MPTAHWYHLRHDDVRPHDNVGRMTTLGHMAFPRNAGVYDEHSVLILLLGYQQRRWLLAASGTVERGTNFQISAPIVAFFALRQRLLSHRSFRDCCRRERVRWGTQTLWCRCKHLPPSGSARRALAPLTCVIPIEINSTLPVDGAAARTQSVVYKLLVLHGLFLSCSFPTNRKNMRCRLAKENRPTIAEVASCCRFLLAYSIVNATYFLASYGTNTEMFYRMIIRVRSA